MTKDVFECMRDSHSVRHFRQADIPEATITRLLEAACWAPSAGNLQPWFFYVVTNKALKEQLAGACYDQEQVREAPVVIVVMADPAKSNERYAERGAQLYCLQDTAAAIQNLLLAAEGLELGACWVGALDEIRIQRLMEAPPRYRAVAIICLGHSAEQDKNGKERLRVAEVAKFIH